DRNRSYYFNLGYDYDQRYVVTASFRKDESNLFGVKSNKKGVPLWSVGGAWNAHRENFMQVSWLNSLRVRLTYGYNGNVDKSATAMLTALTSSGTTIFFDPYYTIQNPPNPSLRWERVENINIGLDFSAGETDRISGTLEFYRK